MSALTAADDFAVLGYRPVSSRTYFAVRLTNVLIFTLLMTAMVSYIPIAVLFVKHGIGAGVARLLAGQGARVVATARRVDRIEGLDGVLALGAAEELSVGELSELLPTLVTG